MNLLQDLLKSAALVLLFTLPGVTVAEEKLDGPAPASVAGTTFVDTAKAQQLKAEGIPFVDVRPGFMYEAERIPGAISLPLPGGGFNREALAKVAGPGDPVVLHCRGKDCMMSSLAAIEAVKWGYSRIYYYRAGFNGWKAAGQQVEVPTKEAMQAKN
ncbi:MAG: rhodanese-like domain-containing protein [Candidatus Sedimenticola sp. PURPLELP]